MSFVVPVEGQSGCIRTLPLASKSFQFTQNYFAEAIGFSLDESGFYVVSEEQPGETTPSAGEFYPKSCQWWEAPEPDFGRAIAQKGSELVTQGRTLARIARRGAEHARISGAPALVESPISGWVVLESDVIPGRGERNLALDEPESCPEHT